MHTRVDAIDSGTTNVMIALKQIRARLDGLLAAVNADGGTAAVDGGGRMTANRTLADKHRVCITSWPICGGPNALDSNDVNSVFAWCTAHGYEGLEVSVDDFRGKWFPGEPYDIVVARVNEAIAASGVPVVGALYHVTDGDQGTPDRRMHKDGTRLDLDFHDVDVWEEMARRLDLDAAIGATYITYQISLPPKYFQAGGEYRHDTAYHKRVGLYIARLQAMCFARGLNFYVETHVDRISEDPEGFCAIMDACPVYFEVNADISHYNYCGITKGPFLERILGRVGHTHQRMARQYGDLSADVPDPSQDWDEKGLTFQAYASMEKALKGGLSSRCIVGESGPIFLVTDALGLDATLVPLYRAMARRADAEAAGTAPPTADNPFRGK